MKLGRLSVCTCLHPCLTIDSKQMPLNVTPVFSICLLLFCLLCCLLVGMQLLHIQAYTYASPSRKLTTATSTWTAVKNNNKTVGKLFEYAKTVARLESCRTPASQTCIMLIIYDNVNEVRAGVTSFRPTAA